MDNKEKLCEQYQWYYTIKLLGHRRDIANLGEDFRDNTDKEIYEYKKKLYRLVRHDLSVEDIDYSFKE